MEAPRPRVRSCAVSITLSTVRVRLAQQRRVGTSFDQAWKMAVKGAKGPTHWALWETRDAWRRAYEGEPMREESAVALLAQLACAQIGLVDDDVLGAITTVGGGLAA